MVEGLGYHRYGFTVGLSGPLLLGVVLMRLPFLESKPATKLKASFELQSPRIEIEIEPDFELENESLCIRNAERDDS